MKRVRDYQEDLINDLKDPIEASAYLNAALKEGDKEAFLLALRNVLAAQGGMTKVSGRMKINRVSLYKMLSKKGNPGFENILNILKTVGIRFEVVAAEPKNRKKAA